MKEFAKIELIFGFQIDTYKKAHSTMTHSLWRNQFESQPELLRALVKIEIFGRSSKLGTSSDEVETHSSLWKASPGRGLLEVLFEMKLWTVIETRWIPWFGATWIFCNCWNKVFPDWFAFAASQSVDSGRNIMRTTRKALLTPIIKTKSLEKHQYCQYCNDEN